MDEPLQRLPLSRLTIERTIPTPPPPPPPNNSLLILSIDTTFLYYCFLSLSSLLFVLLHSLPSFHSLPFPSLSHHLHPINYCSRPFSHHHQSPSPIMNMSSTALQSSSITKNRTTFLGGAVSAAARVKRSTGTRTKASCKEKRS